MLCSFFTNLNLRPQYPIDYYISLLTPHSFIQSFLKNWCLAIHIFFCSHISLKQVSGSIYTFFKISIRSQYFLSHPTPVQIFNFFRLFFDFTLSLKIDFKINFKISLPIIFSTFFFAIYQSYCSFQITEKTKN